MRGLTSLIQLVAAFALLVPAASGTSDPLGAAELFADVEHYVSLGPVEHLTGRSADAATQEWMRAELESAGLQTGRDAYTYYSFETKRAALEVDGQSYASIAPMLYSGSTGPNAVVAPTVHVGTGNRADFVRVQVAGKIAVIEVLFAGPAHTNIPNAVAAAKAGGAVGVIAVTDGPQDFPVNEDVDSRAGPAGLPVLFVGKTSGRAVIEAAQRGATASLLLDAEIDRECTTNAWGVLPGTDPDRFVVVGTPTGAFVPAASERGSGVAALLGLARHYASIPLADRPVTLVFAVLSGHEIGFLGLPTFMQTHPDWFSKADAYVHLGASLAAIQMLEAPDGSVVRLPTGDATRALYISENPVLSAGVHAAFAAALPVGSVPPGALDPGEQGFAYWKGVPIVASSGASYYFHTNGDVPDGVSPSLLAGMTKGFRGAIDYVTSLPAGTVREANRVASALGAARPPNATPGGQAGEEDPDFAPAPVADC